MNRGKQPRKSSRRFSIAYAAMNDHALASLSARHFSIAYAAMNA